MPKKTKKFKYKIIFDSNIVYCDEETQLNKVFNSSIKEVYDLLEENKLSGVKMSFPQLVVDERIAKRLNQIKNNFSDLNKLIKNLEVFDDRFIKERIFNQNKFKKYLNKVADRAIKDFKIEIIPTIKIDQKILIDRALQKVAPFCGDRGKSDKGFKDTLIWLSLLDDAKKNADYNYILLTDDTSGFSKDICEKEFNQYSKKEFSLIQNLDNLKVFLDDKLKLDLKLKKFYKEIEQEILSLQGTITSKLGRRLNDTDNSAFREAMVIPITINVDLYGEEEEKGNFDFHDLKVRNIYKKSDNLAIVNFDLFVKERKGKKNTIFSYPESYVIPWGCSYDKNILCYNVIVQYKRDIKDIEIISAANRYAHNVYDE